MNRLVFNILLLALVLLAVFAPFAGLAPLLLILFIGGVGGALWSILRILITGESNQGDSASHRLEGDRDPA